MSEGRGCYHSHRGYAWHLSVCVPLLLSPPAVQDITYGQLKWKGMCLQGKGQPHHDQRQLLELAACEKLVGGNSKQVQSLSLPLSTHTQTRTLYWFVLIGVPVIVCGNHLENDHFLLATVIQQACVCLCILCSSDISCDAAGVVSVWLSRSLATACSTVFISQKCLYRYKV